MIKSVRLANWRSHSDSRLEFRKGTNLLVGIMGAGKSSILEAISFAFFGTFPALERKKVGLGDVVRLSEKAATVTLEFEWNGSSWKVVRAIERAKNRTATSAELYRDGALVEHGPVAVTDFVTSLLAMDYDLFTRAVYSEQNNIDHFLNLAPGKRKEEMDSLLGLDKFEAARANSVTVANSIRRRREGAEAQFSASRLAALEATEKAQLAEASAAEASLKAAVSAYGAKATELATASAAYVAARKTKDEFERLDREITRLSAQRESLKKEDAGVELDEQAHAAAKERLPALLAERATSAEAIRSLEAKMSALSRETGALEAKVKAASEAAAGARVARAELAVLLGQESAESLQKMQKEAEAAAISADSGRRAEEQKAAETKELMAKLRPGLAECPICSSKLDREGIAHIRAEKDAILMECGKRSPELSALAAAKRKESEVLLMRLRKAALLSERIASLEKDAAQLAALEARKAAAEKDGLSFQSQLSGLREKHDSQSAGIGTLQVEIAKMDGIAARRRTIALAEKSLAELEKKVAGMGFTMAGYEESRARAEALRLEAERARADRDAASARLDSACKMLAMAREELGAARKAEEAIRGLYALEEQLSIYRNALLETQISLRLTLAEAINSAMNELWPVFYPYQNYHALRLGVTEKDYVFEVDDGSGWKPLETVASGGERACAALTLRVALAMVLTPSLGWLILDEPTHNLDSEAVGLLSEALQLKVPEVVKQTFVITHDEAFMGSEFASSYRLARDKGRNGETRIEAI